MLQQYSTHLEFHRWQLVQDLAHAVSNNRPRDLIFTLCCWLHSMTGHVVKSYHVLQHTHCLVEWAETIIGGVAETQQWSTWYVRKCLLYTQHLHLSAMIFVFKYKYEAHTASDFAMEVSGKCGTSYARLALLTELPTWTLSNMKYISLPTLSLATSL
jgi:hypothetical protein